MTRVFTAFSGYDSQCLALDIVRCNGEDCPIRNSCHRYIAGVESTKRISNSTVPDDAAAQYIWYDAPQYDPATQSCKQLMKIN